MRWDVFCRVIDNYGDLGVCWRLAADLGARGEHVRLWVDDPAPLAWMAPHGAPGVDVVPWTSSPPDLAPHEIVVEAFGCDPPADFVARMVTAERIPVWVNLEYLSAEDYVERSHRLPSPQRNGLIKRFFYPGFTARTGGLLREPGLMAARERFRRDDWLAARGITPRPGERLVSVFCYDNPALPALVQRLGDQPTLLLAAPGPAQAAESAGAVRVQALPWLTQADYDRLQWSCDLNFVRGEDSFVRAQWAGAPFVWHIYPQHDGVHADKLDAFLDRFGASPWQRGVFRAWNGLAPWPPSWPDLDDWRAQCLRWRETLLAQPDLVTQLLAFVTGSR